MSEGGIISKLWPKALAHKAVSCTNVAHGGQQQSYGHICTVVGANIRCIGNSNPTFLALVQIYLTFPFMH